MDNAVWKRLFENLARGYGYKRLPDDTYGGSAQRERVLSPKPGDAVMVEIAMQPMDLRVGVLVDVCGNGTSRVWTIDTVAGRRFRWSNCQVRGLPVGDAPGFNLDNMFKAPEWMLPDSASPAEPVLDDHPATLNCWPVINPGGRWRFVGPGITHPDGCFVESVDGGLIFESSETGAAYGVSWFHPGFCFERLPDEDPIHG